VKRISDRLMAQGSPFDRLRVSELAAAAALVLRQAQDERLAVRVTTERCINETARRARG